MLEVLLFHCKSYISDQQASLYGMKLSDKKTPVNTLAIEVTPDDLQKGTSMYSIIRVLT